MLRALGIAAALSLAGAGGALAQASPGAGPVVAAITRFTDAVNRGDMPGAMTYFSPNATVTDDLAPYSWQGPGAGGAWMAAMGANAGAKGMTQINMRLSPASRVEVADTRAYAVVPGLLTFSFKDGHTEQADGTLTFSLQRAGADWKIDALTWTGPAAKP